MNISFVWFSWVIEIEGLSGRWLLIFEGYLSSVNFLGTAEVRRFIHPLSNQGQHYLTSINEMAWYLPHYRVALVIKASTDCSTSCIREHSLLEETPKSSQSINDHEQVQLQHVSAPAYKAKQLQSSFQIQNSDTIGQLIVQISTSWIKICDPYQRTMLTVRSIRICSRSPCSGQSMIGRSCFESKISNKLDGL